MDYSKERTEGYDVREWLAGYLYLEKFIGIKLDLTVLEDQRGTDVFLDKLEINLWCYEDILFKEEDICR